MRSIRKLLGWTPQEPQDIPLPGVRRETAQSSLERGVSAEAAGDSAAALDALGKTVALDPEHAAGHYNLALAYLESDIPFVTLADRPSLGRLGASIATHAGHPGWIASTEDEYADIAVAMAGDLATLSSLRAGLRGTVLGSVLTDEAAYARQVEGAYRQMWRQWCSGHT